MTVVSGAQQRVQCTCGHIKQPKVWARACMATPHKSDRPQKTHILAKHVAPPACRTGCHAGSSSGLAGPTGCDGPGGPGRGGPGWPWSGWPWVAMVWVAMVAMVWVALGGHGDPGDPGSPWRPWGPWRYLSGWPC
eukprot:358845-Chlamydomonas_euryale.AAC.4